MLKKYYIMLLFIISNSLAIAPAAAASTTTAAPLKDGERSITLVYSGDLNGNIRPVYE